MKAEYPYRIVRWLILGAIVLTVDCATSIDRPGAGFSNPAFTNGEAANQTALFNGIGFWQFDPSSANGGTLSVTRNPSALEQMMGSSLFQLSGAQQFLGANILSKINFSTSSSTSETYFSSV